jgi:hypothetical protein
MVVENTINNVTYSHEVYDFIDIVIVTLLEKKKRKSCIKLKNKNIM